MQAGELDAQRLRRFHPLGEAVEIQVIVARAVHLDEFQRHLLRAHMVEIDQFRCLLGKAASQALHQRVRGVDGGQAGDRPLDRLAADLHAVPRGQPPLGGGGDDVVDLSAFQQGEDVVFRRFVKLIHLLRFHARVPQNPRRALCCVKGETQLRKAAHRVRNLPLVAVPDGHEQAAAPLHPITCRDQAFVERFLARFADAEHLARGFHLRVEQHVHIRQLFKGEHRHLHRHVRRRFVKPRVAAHGAQLFAQHRARGKVHHRHAGHLADIRHRPRGTRVHLDDVDFVFVDHILNIDQSARVQREREPSCVVDDALDQRAVEIPRRIYGDRVAGVHARALDMLHDAGNQDVFAVANGVHLDFGPHEILVHEHRLVDCVAQDDRHVFANVLLAERNVHVLPAEHVGRADQHGVAELPRRLHRLLRRLDGQPAGAPDREPLEQRVEARAVLRRVDAVRRRAEDAHAALREKPRELDGGLPAERDDHAVGPLGFDDVLHVLRRQRLKIEAVGGVEIRGNRLRVVVDDDHLEPRALERPDAVDGGIVELDALADADRPRTKDDHAALLCAPLLQKPLRFVFAAVVRVEIRRFRLELRRAGVHHAIPRGEMLSHRFAGEPRKRRVRIAEFFAFLVPFVGQAFPLQRALEHGKVFEFIEKPAVDRGDLRNFLHAHAALERLKHGKEPLVVAVFQKRAHLFVAQCFELRQIERVQRKLRAAHRLEDRLFERWADGHHLAGRLHLRTERAFGVNELVERPFRQLDHHVVQRRLEAGRSLARDRVFQFVQRVSHGDLRRDFRDGVARRLGSQRRRARNARIDLDHRVFKAVGVQRKLAVAAALDAERIDDLPRGRAQHLVFAVGQRYGGRDHDAVPRMHADGIEVFHAADRDDVPVLIPHALELDLLPAGNAALHEDLRNRRKPQAVARNFA